MLASSQLHPPKLAASFRLKSLAPLHSLPPDSPLAIASLKFHPRSFAASSPMPCSCSPSLERLANSPSHAQEKYLRSANPLRSHSSSRAQTFLPAHAPSASLPLVHSPPQAGS